MAKKGPSSIVDRLHRIEGQIRGIEKLVNNDEPVEKISVQIQAAISSLESVKLELVKIQIRDKMIDQVDDLLKLLKK
jgi:DNA-binding FrmR family transcriptional regulator